jgi:hypothetical protein
MYNHRHILIGIDYFNGILQYASINIAVNRINNYKIGRQRFCRSRYTSLTR